MHRSCANRYFLRLSNSSATNKKLTYPCPSCKQEWNKDEVNNILKQTDTTSSSTNKKQRISNRQIVDDDDED